MTGIFITARLGSTRLPDKHLKLIGGKPIIFYLIERIKGTFKDEIERNHVQVVLVTSAEEKNNTFRQFQNSVDIFFGDLKNIPLRHLQAAYTYQLDTIIAVDGDDILCSTEAMKVVKNKLEEGYNYVITTGLPLGLNVFGYSTDFLSDSLKNKKEKILETGWGVIFEESKPKNIQYPAIQEQKDKLRFTLDYQEDLAFFRAIIKKMGRKIFTVSDKELIKFVLREKIYNRNKNRIDEYWENFHAQKEES